MVFLAIPWRVEVRELGLGVQETEVFSGDVGVLADRHVDVMESLNSMALATEYFIDPVEPLGALFGPFCLGGLQLLYRLVMSLPFFIKTRAPQHREQVVAPREGKGVNGGAPQEHRDRRPLLQSNYLTISEGISPCLISMSFVAIAVERSNMAIPASRGVRSSLGSGPLKTIWPSFAYPIARPPTTAAWYRSLTIFFWVGVEDMIAHQAI